MAVLSIHDLRLSSADHPGLRLSPAPLVHLLDEVRHGYRVAEFIEITRLAHLMAYVWVDADPGWLSALGLGANKTSTELDRVWPVLDRFVLDVPEHGEEDREVWQWALKSRTAIANWIRDVSAAFFPLQEDLASGVDPLVGLEIEALARRSHPATWECGGLIVRVARRYESPLQPGVSESLLSALQTALADPDVRSVSVRGGAPLPLVADLARAQLARGREQNVAPEIALPVSILAPHEFIDRCSAERMIWPRSIRWQSEGLSHGDLHIELSGMRLGKPLEELLGVRLGPIRLLVDRPFAQPAGAFEWQSDASLSCGRLRETPKTLAGRRLHSLVASSRLHADAARGH